MAHDVRAIANFVLQLAQSEQRQVTNLALNKIIYFLHAAYLHEYGRPLVTAKIEAWDHGPVFREIYHQFKKHGAKPIQGFANRLDPMTGAFVEVAVALGEHERAFVNTHCSELLKLSPGKLVSMSHVRDGPWYIARFGGGKLNPGVEITDELIRGSGTDQMRH